MADAHILKAIVRTESDFRPLAIGVNTKGLILTQPETRKQAISTATALLDQGHNIDLGLAQINAKNLKKLGLTVEEAFDPCKNLNAAARLLQNDFNRARQSGLTTDRALIAGISAYNTGSFTRGIRNGYVKKVIFSLEQTETPASAKNRSTHRR